MRRRAKILVLTSTFPRRAADAEPGFVMALCARLAEEFDVHVLAPHAPGAARSEVLDGIAVTRYRYAPVRWERLAYDGGILANLRRRPWLAALVPLLVGAQIGAAARLLRRGRYDLIHAHWLLPQGLAAVLATRLARRSIPVVCTAHGGDWFALRGRIAMAFKRWALRRVDTLTVVSRAMEEAVRRDGAVAKRLEIVPMGTDLTRRFTPPPAPRGAGLELLFVGRLVEKKGLEHLLRALPEILRARPEAKLTVAGRGPEEVRLRDLAARLGLGADIRFLGAVPHGELPALFRRATLFVAPFVVATGGDQEGFGLVLVEALGCECPVLTSDLPAVRDIVIPGQTGVLVPPGDPRALAEATVSLLADPTRRRRLASAGRRHVRAHFSWEASGAHYRRILREAIGRSGGE